MNHENQPEFADPPMLLRSPDPNGFYRTNRAFAAMAGFEHTELSAKPFLDCIDPADVPQAKATINGEQASCQVRHLCKSGDPLFIDIRVVDHQGDRVLLGRHVAEETLAAGPQDADDEATVVGTLHTIARILEAQNPGYRCSILLVADGRFVRGAGPSLPEAYNAAIDGFAIGPTVGSCGTAIYWNTPVIVEDIQADPLWVPFAELAKEAGVAACWSHPFASKTGDVLGALAFYSPVPRVPTAEQLGRLRAAAHMTGLAVERGRAEEALRAKRQRELELEDQLRQAAKMEALGVLAGGIAHDFNNVLSTILGNAEFAHELADGNGEVQGMLADIMVATRRAGEFCQQMLAYAGRGSLQKTPLELGGLLPELSRLVNAAISKKTTLEYDLLQEDIVVEGDENQLLQVIMNLITNAAEAIGDQEGRIVVTSRMVDMAKAELNGLAPNENLSAGPYVKLQVSDTGSGMTEETMERIFDPFYTTKFTGRGLGLSAVKGIITQHKGVIHIESTIGEGTTFTVLLPTVDKAASVKASPASIPTTDEPKRILLADDEDALRSILSRRLKHSGFEVLQAANGQEAIDVFSANQDSIDCVVLDLSMPKRNGEEVEQELHALRADLPIILMSGFSEQEVIDRFGDSISGSLQKPVSTAALLEVIHMAMAAA